MEICWNITSKCNINCRHCFRINNENELNYNQIVFLMEKLKDAGVTAISFSGGEFFMVKDAKDILKASHEKGFVTSVTTNASFLTSQKFDEIKPYLDRITFSIEFINDKENEKFGRGKNYYTHLNNIITYINKLYPKFKIKINTTVTSKNIEYLNDIARELEKHSIDSWKLMEFCPLRGTSIENKDELSIGHEIFDEVVNQLSENCNLNVRRYSREKTENQAVVSPSGQLIYSKQDMDIVLLNNLSSQSVDSIHKALCVTESIKLKQFTLKSKSTEVQNSK